VIPTRSLASPPHECLELFHVCQVGHHFGVDAIAFDAQDVSHYYGVLTRLREQAARLRMLIELTLHDR